MRIVVVLYVCKGIDTIPFITTNPNSDRRWVNGQTLGSRMDRFYPMEDVFDGVCNSLEQISLFFALKILPFKQHEILLFLMST